MQKQNEKAIICLTYLADNQDNLSKQFINFPDTWSKNLVRFNWRVNLFQQGQASEYVTADI